MIGYALAMTDEERQMLRDIIEYCDSQCAAAYEDMEIPCDSPALAERRKVGYAAVSRRAYRLLIEDGG
jgi:hypothetical protein